MEEKKPYKQNDIKYRRAYDGRHKRVRIPSELVDELTSISCLSQKPSVEMAIVHYINAIKGNL